MHPPADVAAAARALADEALARAGILLEEAHDAAACRSVSEVLGRVWGRTGAEMLDPALLVALTHAGNPVTLALREDEPVGAAMGFCGPPGTPFHSHIVGLLPEAAGRGAGRAIKLAQRAWCLECGIDAMTWTFDPLVRRNAHFNIRTLGARPAEYLPSLYGEMRDAINAGQDSDRMLVRWDLTRTPPERGGAVEVDGAHAIADEGDVPSAYARPSGDGPALLATPTDIEALRRTDPEAARRWRSETRAAFTDLLATGWGVDGFTDAGQYVLRRADQPTEGTP
ncbi:hypothetical protein B5M43_002760 [Microbacterium sp. MEC084]|uniref:hypothetical protein n=1 Tax=unclassified Microbacterium TaxID=2609290 RepID=UPI0007009406|nr:MULTISPECIES: hypothetical protein [unclassified Microbacterium]KQZ09914.1 hypothetical protein ASD19_11050 [Microbacterium sp. Root53]MCD1267770.1 hypothetical protein [Microbacterium sp. MEC084]